MSFRQMQRTPRAVLDYLPLIESVMADRREVAGRAAALRTGDG